MSDTTPTVSELLNAANWEYQQVGTPADLTPFTVDGQQLTAKNQADGMSGAAWLTPQGQVVISYEGTELVGLSQVLTDPTFSVNQVLEDSVVAAGSVTPGEKDALAFAQTVRSAAAARGIGDGDVFVTGHSLGAIQAQYVAQQTGLGGIAFEPTGIPRSSTTAGTGTNFIDIVQAGDPVANYGSDLDTEQPFSPAYSVGGTGALPHYGYVATIGDPAADAALKAEAALEALGTAGFSLTTLAYAGMLVAYHLPSVQAYSLGVTLTQTSLIDQIGIRSGPVLGVANDTIPELIAATNAQLSSPLPADPTVSASGGASSGTAASYLAAGYSFAYAAGLAALLPASTRAADGPGIAGMIPGQSTTSEFSVLPFSGVTVTSGAAGDTVSTGIQIGGAGGTLAGAGLTNNGNGSYTLAAGTPALLTSELDALAFTPANTVPGSAAVTTFTLVELSSDGQIAVGTTSVTDTAAADAVSVAPQVTYGGDGGFVIGGKASSVAGVTGVEISAVVDGVATDLGAATVAADGSFTFADHVGANLEGFITATETDGLGRTTAASAGYSLQGGLGARGDGARQTAYTADGSAETSVTRFAADGSRSVRVDGGGQTFTSDFFDRYDNGGAPGTTFVFTPNHGLDTVRGFRVDGTDHDTIVLPSADFTSLAQVLQNTRTQGGTSTIVDPTTGDAVKLVGVTKAQLVANKGDFAFGA